MHHEHTRHLPVLAAATLALAACGGSDSSEPETPASTAPEAPSSEPADDDGDTADDSGADGSVSDDAASASGASLAEGQRCLEAGGYSLEPGDESTTSLSPEMMANLGIDEILVFDDGAGSAGTIELYASVAQAEIAADGYEGSPLGYQVGAEDLVVFKTTGAATVIDDIGACLRGEPIEAAAGDQSATADEAMDDAADDGAADDDAADEVVEEPAPTDEAPSADEPSTGSNVTEEELGAARLGIIDMLINPDLEAQGVILDRACLEAWSLGLSDADAELLLANGGDTEDPAVSAEGAAQAERVFTCLDLERLSVSYAEDGGYDVECVATAFAGVDIQAVVDERGADIDEIFRALADAAFDCG